MKKLSCILLIASLLLSCKKEKGSGKQVAFYQLDSFNYVAGECRVNASTAVLKTSPFISNNEIISYSQIAYSYRLSPAAINRIKAFEGRVPFAVTVDGQVIFYAFFNAMILSSSCEHSVSMQLDVESSDRIMLQLGYPGTVQGVPVDDQRNNPVLLQAFSSQGKLE